MIAWKGAPDGVAEIAVGRLLAPVIAGGDGDDFLVAGIAVVVDALVAVAGGETDHAAFTVAALVSRNPSPDECCRAGARPGCGAGRWRRDQSPSVGPQLHEMTSAPFCAAQTKASASACEPSTEASRIGIRRALGRHARCAEIPVRAGHAGAGRAMIISVARPRIVGVARDVARRDDLAGRSGTPDGPDRRRRR